MQRMALFISALTAWTFLADDAWAVTIDTVPVGNTDNMGEQSRLAEYGDDTYFGTVSHIYSIGKYEVTAGQYRDFLNAVDPSGMNTLGLYNANMNDDSAGCQITWNSTLSTYDFSGGTVESPGSTAADWENRPVNYVSFWDAARFCNWLHNGQGSGDTENGAYHDIDNQSLFGRNPDATYFIPTENEWYKAAYHDKSDGLAATYFDYPTSSDIAPGRDMTETTSIGNNANFNDGGYLIGSPYYRTEVGDFEISVSPYGTFDQGGNVWEWNETVIDGSSRGLRGGGWSNTSIVLHSSRRGNGVPSREDDYIGFRVASIPEPGTLALLFMGIFGLLSHGWRRRR